jgi:hypothetical protein
MVLGVLTLVVSLAATMAGEGEEMLLGEQTAFSKTLLGDVTDSFYGMQIVRRGSRACQVRGFFRGRSPQTAQYCSGRVRASHVRNAAVAVVGVGERVHGISACRNERGYIAVVRLHTESGDQVAAWMEDCASDFQEVHCGASWAVQGVQLYFDGDREGRAHRRLRGIRPLCSIMSYE